MPLLMLTTLDRVRAAVNLKVGVANTEDSDLLSCIGEASSVIQGLSSRGINVESRVEARVSNPSGILFLKCYPVRSIASVEISDGRGGWTSSSFWLAGENELHYDAPRERVGMRITYTGGAAYSVDTSLETVASFTGTPAPGTFTTQPGSTGSLVAYNSGAGTASIKCTSGQFSEGDVLTGTGWTITLGATIQESILSDWPELAKAGERQAAYAHQRKNSLGRTAVTAGGMTTFSKDLDILDSVAKTIDLFSPKLIC
jgi:hypothetical protein